MKGVKKIVLLILLLSAIILPQTIQNYHTLTSHHHISLCDTHCPKSNHFHEATEHCPIHEFVFKIYSFEGFLPNIPNPFEIDYLVVSYNLLQISQRRVYQYLSRGPPSLLFF